MKSQSANRNTEVTRLLSTYRRFSITITTVRLFDSYWEETSPKRKTHVRTTASGTAAAAVAAAAAAVAENRVHRRCASQRIGDRRSTGGRVSWGWRGYTRSGASTQRLAKHESSHLNRAAARRRLASRGLPRLLLVGRSVGGRLEGWLVARQPAFWSQLSRNHHWRRRLKNNNPSWPGSFLSIFRYHPFRYRSEHDGLSAGSWFAIDLMYALKSH